MSSSFELPSVQHLTVGTVGEPGHRTFYLQARQDDQLVTLKIEKQQVRVLAERLLELLARHPRRSPRPAPELAEPVLAEWPVGALRILDDRDGDQIVLMAEEVAESDSTRRANRSPPAAMARFGATRTQVAALARRGMELVEVRPAALPAVRLPPRLRRPRVPTDERQPVADALTVLAEGEIEIQGRMPWSSNATFLVSVTLDGARAAGHLQAPPGGTPAVGLPRRAVPPRGGGLPSWPRRSAGRSSPRRSCAPTPPSAWARCSASSTPTSTSTTSPCWRSPATAAGLQAMAAFDLVANNADRKGGHCLLDAEDRIWGIDHGLCFNAAPKLRTVIWDFAGEPIAEPLLADLRRLALEPPAAARGAPRARRRPTPWSTGPRGRSRDGRVPRPRARAAPTPGRCSERSRRSGSSRSRTACHSSQRGYSARRAAARQAVGRCPTAGRPPRPATPAMYTDGRPCGR